MQIIMIGYQDSFLTKSPDITYFKQVYKRHTNFAIEPIPQFFNVKPDFGTRVTCTIAKNADLISRMYLVVTLPSIGKFIDYPGDVGEGNSKIACCAWVKKIGFQLIKQIELEIGGQVIDRHYADWLNIWSELTTPLSKRKGLDKMIGNIPELYELSNGKNKYQLYIPLMFWFCRHPNMALPIIALHNTDVKVNIEFNQLDDCLILSPSHYILIDDEIVLFKQNDIIYQQNKNTYYYARFIYHDTLTKRLYYTKITPEEFQSNLSINNIQNNFSVIPNGKERIYLDKTRYFPHLLNLSLGSAYLLIDYIYLDIRERLNFYNSKDLQYLIDVLQFDNDRLVFHSNNKIKIGYINPCKELIFRGQYDYITSGYSKDKFNYTNLNNESIIKRVQFLLNGQERLKEKTSQYFEWLHTTQNHTSNPSLGINVYSFSLKPEDHQPTGSCNLSKMDDIVLGFTVDKGVSYQRPIKLRIYALTMNLLKIEDGIIKLGY